MRLFRFDLKNYTSTTESDNRWLFRVRFISKMFAIASLKAPIEKYITFNRRTVYYINRNVFCLGLVGADLSFRGVAIFEFPERFLVFALIFVGVWWVSNSILAGLGIFLLFYIYISALCYNDDETMLNQIKRKLEK